MDDFENPSPYLPIQTFNLTDETLTYLQIPAGCITAIQAKEKDSKLLVLSDYSLGEIKDEYRYPINYFINLK